MLRALTVWIRNQYISWRYDAEFQRILEMKPGARYLRMQQLGFYMAEEIGYRQVYRHKSGAEISFRSDD